MLVLSAGRIARIAGALILVSASCPPVQGQQTDILQRASKSYYSLRDQGLRDFRCTIALNPKAIVISNGQMSAAYIQLLADLRFAVSFDGDKRWTVNPTMASHRSIEPSFSGFAAGLSEAVERFWMAWSEMAFLNQFREPTHASVMSEAHGYRFTSPDGKVVIHLSDDFTEEDTSLPGAQSRASFTKTERGLLFTAYEVSTVEHSQVHLSSWVIQYKETEGLMMPVKLVGKLSNPGQVISYEMAISQYQIHKVVSQ